MNSTNEMIQPSNGTTFSFNEKSNSSDATTIVILVVSVSILLAAILILLVTLMIRRLTKQAEEQDRYQDNSTVSFSPSRPSSLSSGSVMFHIFDDDSSLISAFKYKPNCPIDEVL